MSGPDVGWWRAVAWLCGLGLLFAALFNAWPALDLAAAQAFYEDGRFPLGETDAARMLRAAYRQVFTAACVLAGAGLAARLGARAATRVPWRLWAYPVLLFVIGPGLIANGLLKERWGRARPAEIDLFGGDRRFSLPFEIAGQCESNCSFVSGEGSAAAALVFALIGLFWRRLGPVGRISAGTATAAWLLGAAFIRMAPGRHFLSDTLFAFVLMGLTAAALYRALGVGRLRGAFGPAEYGRDLLAGARALAGAAARIGRRPRG